MKLQDWEVTIRQMIEESNHECGNRRVLKEWRAKLAKEPHFLQSFQIDEIMREVWKRLSSVRL